MQVFGSPHGVILPELERTAPTSSARLRAVVSANYSFLWRCLRRLGVDTADADDAAQKVLLVFARKIDDVASGAERAYLFQTAVRVAADARKANARTRVLADDDQVASTVDPSPNAEEQLDRVRARALLDEALDAMPLELRAVFVLFELEELSTSAIAELIDVPAGTVSSRLHRARHEFEAIATRLRARHSFRGRRQ